MVLKILEGLIQLDQHGLGVQSISLEDIVHIWTKSGPGPKVGFRLNPNVLGLGQDGEDRDLVRMKVLEDLGRVISEVVYSMEATRS